MMSDIVINWFSDSYAVTGNLSYDLKKSLAEVFAFWNCITVKGEVIDGIFYIHSAHTTNGEAISTSDIEYGYYQAFQPNNINIDNYGK